MPALLLTILISNFAHAGFPCQANMCNPYNGCVDGCMSSELQCAPPSDGGCLGQDYGSKCRMPNGYGAGYCTTVSFSHHVLVCGCR